ncbi:ead/Ea22-like family protein [Klebsiella variicola]|uniref:ead/Ea22-like family protein n=1 Tax=Klebsiella variicola TaxID=244366 RepID=UPI0010354506|nr:ead/Ea22-like family protein [Klebsiella variicola]
MTTDITELAQSLKAAAEKATPGEWVYFPKNTSIEYDVGSDESQGSILYVDSGDFTQAQTDRNGEFIALANPANILALVEALEKAQGMEAYWKTQCRGITDHCEELQARIAQLESCIVTAAAADVLAERKRQVTTEGWTPEHDDQHVNFEMAIAGGLYAISAVDSHHKLRNSAPSAWPWDRKWWKPDGPRRDLVKAGALILAEIERLDRAAGIKVEAE